MEKTFPREFSKAFCSSPLATTAQQQQQIKTVLEYLGNGKCWCRSKKLSRNCLAAMFYLISSENLVTFDAVSASQFSFSLGTRVGCGLSKKKEKEGTRKRSLLSTIFFCAVSNQCAYIRACTVSPADGRDLSAFARELKWENTVPSPPLPYPISIKSMTVQLLARRRRCGECHIRL